LIKLNSSYTNNNDSSYTKDKQLDQLFEDEKIVGWQIDEEVEFQNENKQ